MQSIRILQPGEEAVLEQFLARRPESSMIMRSNLRAAGLEDRGLPNHATYGAAFEDGVIIAAAPTVGTAWSWCRLPTPWPPWYAAR